MVLAVFCAPFPYGGVTGDEALRIELLAFAAAGVAAFSKGATAERLRAVRVPLAALAGLAVLGVVQLVPLPGALLRVVAPGSAAVWESAARTLAVHGHGVRAGRVSIAPTETSATILLALAYGALFVAVYAVSGTRTARRLLVATLFAAAIVALAYAGATSGDLDRLHGSFVNPNNLAGYLQITLSLSFALLWLQIKKSRRRRRENRTAWLERRLPPVAAAALLWGTVAAGIGLSRSRGGVLAAALATPVLLALAALHRRRGTRSRASVAASLCIVAAVAFAATITKEGPLERLLGSDPSELGSDGRVRIWRGAVAAFRASPLVGWGLGAFREAFRPFQPSGLDGLVEQAHDEPLQILVTGGAAGGALALALVVAVAARLLTAFFAHRHREEAAWALAGIGALLALTLHGLVEFNFSIPAVPATLAVLLGMACASAGWHRHGERAAESPAITAT